ncbi:MAG TPA: alpha/beta hydrolase [Actinomycetota bacterium]|nr:alpha/beta hydrolase [Actinomycetota bacterium]
MDGGACRRALGRGLAIVLAIAAAGISGTSGGSTPPARAAADQDEGLPPVQTGPIVISDVPYAQHDGEMLSLDVYRMEDPRPAPGLVLVHGGSWRRRSKEVWSTLASLYAREGYVVFAIDYRLAPPGGDTRFPDPARDVETAVDWVRRNAETYGVDAGRVAVAGSSAGGQLALMAATSETLRPDAVVLFSAPIDLERLHREGILTGPIENYLGCSPELCPDTYRRTSGRRAVDAATPPMLVAFSRYELIPRDQPRRLVKRLETFGLTYETVELGGTRHGMSVASATFDETVRFLDRTL